MGFKEVAKDKKGLQKITGGYKGLRWVTER